MNYTAYITRILTMADESIEIILDDVSDLQEFKEKVYNSLKMTDYRANIQMNRLFEDTDLTDTLKHGELQKARKAAQIVYPLEGIPKKLKLGGEKGAIQFSKIMASGESLKIFLHAIEEYEEIDSAIKAIWEILDSRLEKTNKRELDFIKYISQLDTETKIKVTKIMEILYGRVLKEEVIKSLRGNLVEELKETVEGMRNENLERNINNAS